MDVVGAIGGATGAAVWAVAGARAVSKLRPSRQMPVFTAGAVAFALAGGLAGSSLPGPAPTAVVRTVATGDAPTGGPDPTTTSTMAEPETTTSTAAETTTSSTTPAPAPAPAPRRRSIRRYVAPLPTAPQPVTARCADGWGIYGRNRFTHACDTHGGVSYWIVEPTN